MLQFNGRPVRWFGVGDPDDIGPGITNLQATIKQYSGRITNPSKAVADLQAAGNMAVSTVGPAIDALSGGNPDVMKRTQAAWTENKRLATVNSSGATGSDVDAAKTSAQEMIDNYQQAQNLATSLASKTGTAPATPSRSSAPAPRLPTAPSTPPASPDVPDGGGFLDWLAANKTAVAIGGAVVVAGGIAVVAATVPRRRAA